MIWVDLKGVLGLIAIQPFWGLFLFVGILLFAGGLILPGLMRRPAVDIQNGHVRFKTLLRTYEFAAGRPPAFFYPLTVYFYTVLMMKVRKGNGYKGFAVQIHNMRHLNGDKPDPETLQMDMMGVKRLDGDDREMFAYAERYRGFIGSIRAMGWAFWLILIMAIVALTLRGWGWHEDFGFDLSHASPAFPVCEGILRYQIAADAKRPARFPAGLSYHRRGGRLTRRLRPLRL
ncbi:hypothetical protein [uncultured Celeribacter sp.]|uniref:hypothetical protein n=1 Tax=uncultured Celeribacter sp. TaxID=1303376 RepID=UPI00374A69F6